MSKKPVPAIYCFALVNDPSVARIGYLSENPKNLMKALNGLAGYREWKLVRKFDYPTVAEAREAFLDAANRVTVQPYTERTRLFMTGEVNECIDAVEMAAWYEGDRIIAEKNGKLNDPKYRKSALKIHEDYRMDRDTSMRPIYIGGAVILAFIIWAIANNSGHVCHQLSNPIDKQQCWDAFD